MIKTIFLLKTKQKENVKKIISKHRVAFSTLNSPSLLRDITCSKLSRYGENTGDKKLSVEHTPEVDPNVSPFQ